MKAKVITGLKKEVLVIEAKSKDIACGFIFNKYGLKELLKWELLGKPDEIKEEDLHGIVSDFDAFKTTNEGSGYYDYIEAFNSALESEIYWENPHGKEEPKCIRYGTSPERIKNLDWRVAQEKTFDRNRSLIFVKN